MAGEPGVPYRADTGGGTSNAPDLRAPLGAPNILRPEDFIAMANFNDPTVALKSAYDLTSSLIDNHYNNQIKLAKSQADLSETAARTGYYGAQTDNIQSESEQRKQLMPLAVQRESQAVQQNDYALKEAQRQSDLTDKALSEYGPWNSELSALDPNDPDYDDKVAAINAKYPEASTNPRTQALITPMLTEHNVKRNHSDLVQQRVDQLNQTRGYVESGLLPPDTDIRTEVNAGRGQALINQAKSQSVIHRLQTISALGTPGDRYWAQGEIGAISGKALGPGETPDRTMFTPTGDLNPGTDLVLSRIESRLGITPVAPGAKKETKVETGQLDKDTEGTRTTTTITGQPVTQADIDAQKAKQTPPAPVQGAPTTIEAMQKDPIFQSIVSDIAQKKLTLQGAGGSQEQTAALYAEYAKRRAAAAAGQQPAQPSALPAPNAGTAGPAPGSTPMSNNDYRVPGNASNHAGINANVWANVMSEEGREFGKDGSHDSVFGLWADKPGVEGEAYQAVKQNGPDSLAAYNAVTNAWTNKFLRESQPWNLQSPGLQEMVIADSQHQGGAAARAIIDQMGGFDKINAMPADQAIREYSEARKPLWPGNNKPFPNGATDRVTRERDWALRHNDELAGASSRRQGQASAMPVHESGHPMPRTPREAMTLGPGARFMAPDGTLRMVPNIPQYA